MQTIISQFHASSKQGLEIIAGALDAFAKAAADKVTQALRNPIAADPEAEQYELDAKLWDSAPTIAVPKFAEFKQLEEIGHPLQPAR